MPQKLYCYVDESGQDTRGKLFVVSVVVAAEDRDILLEQLEKIEDETGKGRVKWYKTSYPRRVAYMRRVLEMGALRGKLNFAIYRDTLEYLKLTSATVVSSLIALGSDDYRVTVLIDALPPSQAHLVSRSLRNAKIRFVKVRGIKHEESNALIRLADALCGFVRAVFENQSEMEQLFERARRTNVVRDVS